MVLFSPSFIGWLVEDPLTSPLRRLGDWRGRSGLFLELVHDIVHGSLWSGCDMQWSEYNRRVH